LLFPRATCASAERHPLQFLAGWFSVAIVLAAPAFAEDPPHRVGSLNYISGEVNYALRPETGDPAVLSWATADFNQPVCQDMSLQTGPLARARIRIGPNAIQMSSDTLLDMLNLNDQLIEASIRQGRVYLQLRDLGEGESVEIEIPRGSLWLLKSGAYDIETPGTTDQPARITVFEGKARFVGGPADVPIEAGEEIQVAGIYPAIMTTQRAALGFNPAPANAQSAMSGAGAAAADLHPNAPAATSNPSVANIQPRPDAAANAHSATSDDFVAWVADSEPNPSAEPSPRHASLQMTGYDELQPYGQWRTLDDYGPVWFPTSVSPEWAPYRYGHWTSIAPWGWTWIDDQPWGFAPFHFGRWVYVDDRWGWAPGDPVDHPVYAPALVAFLDASELVPPAEGADPPVGWFPLAPGDAYAPWFAAGPAYVESVNVAYPRRFHEDPLRWREERGREVWRGEFANRRFATFVRRDVFAHGRPIEREMMRMPAERLERAMVMREAPRVMPAVMRTMAGPGGLHSEPRGMAPGMIGPGAAHGEAHGITPGTSGQGGPHGVAPGMSGGGAFRNEQHAMTPMGPHTISPAGVSPRGFSGPGAPAVAARLEHGGPSVAQQYGRPEVFHTPAPSYRAGAAQYGRPMVARTPQMVGRGMPAMTGRVAPQVAARPALGGGGAPHKK
jgi:Family of unknown function (DUF6600)